MNCIFLVISLTIRDDNDLSFYDPEWQSSSEIAATNECFSDDGLVSDLFANGQKFATLSDSNLDLISPGNPVFTGNDNELPVNNGNTELMSTSPYKVADALGGSIPLEQVPRAILLLILAEWGWVYNEATKKFTNTEPKSPATVPEPKAEPQPATPSWPKNENERWCPILEFGERDTLACDSGENYSVLIDIVTDIVYLLHATPPRT
ncbi:hypothetical protein MMC22_004577 [Lobaria immixta]|nr:hypothetical protein [Lobaria immixta]